ncbi:MFS transporter [Cohnella kolymensis]|nr:MFS transporter [Cohnella kolymensis]
MLNSFLQGFRRTMGIRQIESVNRKGLRTALIEGIPANIIANLLGGPLQTIYLTYLGFTAVHIGLVLAIPPFAMLIQIVIAIAMQKWHNRKLFLSFFAIAHRALWVCTGLIPLFFSQDAWIPVYIALWLVSFLAAHSSGVIWTSLMADLVPKSVRGKYFGIRNTIHWAVVCVTLFAGGQIMEWLPGTTGFIILFSISGICVIWNAWELSRYPNPPFQPSDSGTSYRMLFRPFSDKLFLSSTLFISVFILVENVVIPLFAYVMLEVMNLSTTMVTLIAVLQNLVMMVSYYYWGILNGRYSTNTLLLWTFPIIALSCVVWAGMVILPALLILVVVHIMLGFGLAGYNLLVFNFLIGDSPKSERPMYIAVFSAFTGIAGFIGPIAGGWLYDQADTGPRWLQTYGMTSIAGAAMLLLALGIAPFVFSHRRGHSRVNMKVKEGAKLKA